MGFLDRAQQELERAQHESSYSVASGQNYHYVVLQVTLKEKFIGTGSGNLTELENVVFVNRYFPRFTMVVPHSRGGEFPILTTGCPSPPSVPS